ncbi:MAG TPA: hypothetical protein VGD14_07815 [bacterium]
MKRQFLKLVFFICLIALSSAQSPAQISKDVQENLKIPDSEHFQIITTHDKSTMIGRILEIREKEIRFKAEFGEITIPIDKITSIEIVPASSIKEGVYWFPNPNATRLFFAPTARMLNKGDGYFADYYLFFPAFAYGITNNITIGGGMSLIPGIDIDKQIFYFTPKVGLSATKNFNLGIGALIIKIPDFDGDEEENEDDIKSPLVGLLYGVGTYGNPNSSLTVGLGYGFVDDEVADKPMIMIGGEHRISRRLALVTENWILPGVDNPMVSYGVRFFGEKMSFDLALLNTMGKDAVFPGIPYVDFVFNF